MVSCVAPEIQIDESIVMQLVSMGFDMEGCRKAVYHTNNLGRSKLIFCDWFDHQIEFETLYITIYETPSAPC